MEIIRRGPKRLLSMDDSTSKNAAGQKTGFFKRFFHHPNFNVAVGIFGIMGVLWGVYSYFDSIKKPDLLFYVSPSRIPIVHKGNLENFSVTFRGLPVNGDLSAATIQIWNAGKQPIRGADILTPITLSTGNGAPIYQLASQATRDVVGIKMQFLTNNPAILAVSWNILEQNDGIKLQVIYGGDVNLPLIFNGVVIGQKGITQYTDPKRYVGPVGVFIFICFNFAMLLFISRTKVTFIPLRIIVTAGLALIGIAALGYYVFNVSVAHTPFPP